jgi:hypothetical protein
VESARSRRRPQRSPWRQISQPTVKILVFALLGVPVGALAAELELRWTESPYDAVSGFAIERRSRPDDRFLEIGRVGPGMSGYRDGNLEPGVRYCYRIRALGKEGASLYSTPVCAMAKEQSRSAMLPDGEAMPAEAVAASLAAGSRAEADIHWSLPADERAPHGFAIERRSDAHEDFVEVARVGREVTAYRDAGLEPGVEYCYRLRALDERRGSGEVHSELTCVTASPDLRFSKPPPLPPVEAGPPESTAGEADPRRRPDRVRVQGGWLQIVTPPASQAGHTLVDRAGSP